MNGLNAKQYRYRPVLFFVLTYLFTWLFWIPAVWLPETISPVLMLIGLLAPAAVSTVFIMASGSDALKRDLKNKIGALLECGGGTDVLVGYCRLTALDKVTAHKTNGSVGARFFRGLLQKVFMTVVKGIEFAYDGIYHFYELSFHT